MRVISGIWKGRPLGAPPGTLARPTTDRVKESMFNLMGPNWHGEVVIDLFAGSGALGIEALSRGASHAVFVDKSPKSMNAVKENLARLGVSAEATLMIADWAAGWRRVGAGHSEVGWVFVDPPYAKQLWEPVLQTIAESGVRVRFGVLCEHPKGIVLPEAVGTLVKAKERTYGDIGVTIYHDEQVD